MNDMRERRPVLPWVVWGVAVAAYAVAIIGRSSLAALGPATQQHFEIDATALSMFAVIQLIVYSALQIPVGLMLDRLGSTRMILIGAVLIIVGQVVMATVWDVRLAILARVLVGAGDACTFISVVRLLPEWFSLRQLPVISQLTGLIGQIGQMVSIGPLALIVAQWGWATGFLSIAGIGALVAILSVITLRDSPGASTSFERLIGRQGRISRTARSFADFGGPVAAEAVAPPPTEIISVVPRRGDRTRAGDPAAPGVFTRLRRLASLPGIRLAFWVHFTAPFAGNVFLLLWGTPFLTGGLHFSLAEASSLLSLSVMSMMLGGILLGPITSRFIERRAWVALGIIGAIASTWIAVILWPGEPPLWLVIVLVVVIPLGGPVSMVSFEIARSHAPRSYAGVATGFVNMAGFTASLIAVFLTGILLDLQGAGDPENYSREAFDVAFAAQIPLWIIGVTLILIEMRRTKRWMQSHGRRLR